MANLPETPQWEDGIYQIEVSDPVLGGPDGITNRPLKQLASRTLYLKQKTEEGSSSLAAHIAAADPHTQYAPKVSPVLTGTPTAPTAPQTTNNQQIANTAFVKAALAALVASSPAALDTLNELAAALGNDPNFATTMKNALANKQPLDVTLTALSGKTISGLLEYLRLGAGAPAIGIPFFWPLAAMPNTIMYEWSDMVFLKPNGASFSAATYPKLAKVWTGLVIPDMRGEFPRIWDDGRGVDSGRGLLTSQAQSVQRHSHDISMAYGTSASGTKDVLGQSPNSDFIPIKGMNGATIFTGIGNFYLIDNATTTAETRPRNIALNFLVRAK
ncbi:phage tail protein [Citrobacter farmeri]